MFITKTAASASFCSHEPSAGQGMNGCVRESRMQAHNARTEQPQSLGCPDKATACSIAVVRDENQRAKRQAVAATAASEPCSPRPHLQSPTRTPICNPPPPPPPTPPLQTPTPTPMSAPPPPPPSLYIQTYSRRSSRTRVAFPQLTHCSALVWYLLISLCGAIFEQPF